jgi:hypothetical protein
MKSQKLFEKNFIAKYFDTPVPPKFSRKSHFCISQKTEPIFARFHNLFDSVRFMGMGKICLAWSLYAALGCAVRLFIYLFLAP